MNYLLVNSAVYFVAHTAPKNKNIVAPANKSVNPKTPRLLTKLPLDKSSNVLNSPEITAPTKEPNADHAIITIDHNKITPTSIKANKRLKLETKVEKLQ